jgi:hypothetical protein
MSELRLKINPIPLERGVELKLGQRYALTPAQKLAIQDMAGFFPYNTITCIDVGCKESIEVQETPTWSEHEGWIMPGAWRHQEYLPPAFSDSVRGRHWRTVRIDLDVLVETAQNERYVEFERREHAKREAAKKRAAERARTGKSRKPRKERKVFTPDISMI